LRTGRRPDLLDPSFERLFERRKSRRAVRPSTPASPGGHRRQVIERVEERQMRHETGEPIEVAPFDGAPAQFLLRGRLHVVRAVLASWTEPGGWRWSGPGRVVAAPVPVGAAAGGRAFDAIFPSVPSAATDPIDLDGRGREVQLPFIPSVPIDLGDRDVWRVEAAAGMSDRPRVFDLCREPEPEQPRWTATLVEE
jgi:hypothetical protein